MSTFTESIVEEAAVAWLEAMGFAVVHGPEIASDQPDRNGAITDKSC
jgi:type I restriction enzyme R subunit